MVGVAVGIILSFALSNIGWRRQEVVALQRRSAYISRCFFKCPGSKRRAGIFRVAGLEWKTEPKARSSSSLQVSTGRSRCRIDDAERNKERNEGLAANYSLYLDDKGTSSSRPLTFIGKHKWLGGAVDNENDGSIYGIPSHASEIICLSPPATCGKHNDTSPEGEFEVWTIPLPSYVTKGKFKWLRGIICGGYLYGIPAWARAGVLKVDIAKLQERRKHFDVSSIINETEADAVSILPIPGSSLPVSDNTETQGNETTSEAIEPSRWLWHGAALNANKTAIYCIPSNAKAVLKIDLLSSQTSLLPIPASSTPLEETNKWYGGILGDDS